MNPNPLAPNPFAVLGLPEWPDLDDETVRAAWRQIAAETHPDRADGGNLARYTQACAAFAELRIPWSRSEAYADLEGQARAAGYDGLDEAGQPYIEPLPDGPPPVITPADLPAVLAQLPSRIRRGRPVRLLLRAAVAAVLAVLVLNLIPGTPVPADIAVVTLWFVLTGREDLAPPAGL
jgi:hypothetical protein